MLGGTHILGRAAYEAPRSGANDRGIPGTAASLPDYLQGVMEEIRLTSLDSDADEWRLQLHGDAASLRRPDGSDPIHVERAAIATTLEVVQLWGGQPVLVVRPPGKKKLILKLLPEQRELVEEWIGPPTSETLRVALRRRYAFAAPIAVLLVLLSMPLPADDAAGIAATPFDYVSFVLGLGLLFFWAHARIRPKPYLFLLDSGWFALLILSVVADVLLQGASSLWLLWAVLLTFLVHSGLKQHRRFRTVSGAAPELPRPAL